MNNFLSNKSLNKLHLHYGLIRFAENITTTFGVIILYKMGYELYQVFLIFGIMHFSRIFFRSFLPRVIKKIGLKNTVILGTIIYVILLPIFYFTTSNIIPIWIYIIFFSITTSFYWYPFHILYGIVGDNKNRGKQSAIRELYYRIAQILSPIASGVILSLFGFIGLFISGTIIFLLALLALINIKDKINISLNSDFKNSFKDIPKFAFFMSLFFSFWEIFFDFAWVLFLYILFNQSELKLGIIMGIIMLSRTIIDYYVGHSIDLKKKIKLYYFGGGIIFLSIFLRTYFSYSLSGIIILNTLLMLGYSLFLPYESVVQYNSIKDSKNPEYTALLAEAGWDIGTMLACLILAIGCFLKINLLYLMPIGLISIGLSIMLYNKYFYCSK